MSNPSGKALKKNTNTENKPSQKAVELLYRHYNLWLIQRELKKAPMRRAARVVRSKSESVSA